MEDGELLREGKDSMSDEMTEYERTAWELLGATAKRRPDLIAEFAAAFEGCEKAGRLETALAIAENRAERLEPHVIDACRLIDALCEVSDPPNPADWMNQANDLMQAMADLKECFR
jgi:hypothetical protein